VTSILKTVGIKNLTVQVEKETYYHHITALNSANGSVEPVQRLSYNSSIVRAI